jgi:DNA-binding PadR family transcriptional regulator
MDRRGRRQFFRPGEVPIALLSLLVEQPQGGYALMGALRERYGPGCQPSPGSVYPALAALVEAELIQRDPGRREGTYRATAAGREMLNAKAGVLTDLQHRESPAEQDDAVDAVLERLAQRVRSRQGDVDSKALERILARAADAVARLQSAVPEASNG